MINDRIIEFTDRVKTVNVNPGDAYKLAHCREALEFLLVFMLIGFI